MSHHGTEIKNTAHPLCSEQYFGLLAIGSLKFNILLPSYPLNPTLLSSGSQSRLQSEVRLMNESVEGIRLLWDGHCSWFQAVRQADIEDWWITIVHSLVLSVTPDIWPGSPSISDTSQIRARNGLIDWLDTEWYLLLNLSILTTWLLANIKMDNSHQVQCEIICVPLQQIIQYLAEKCLHFCFSPENSQIKSGQRSLEHISKVIDFSFFGGMRRYGNHHHIQLVILSYFSSQIASLIDSGRHFKWYTIHRRGILIASPLYSLSSALLHEPYLDSIIHHILYIFCHFLLGFKKRAGKVIDFKRTWSWESRSGMFACYR